MVETPHSGLARRESNQGGTNSGLLPPSRAGSGQGQARSAPRKRKGPESGPGKSSKKRRKSMGAAGSSGSALTSVAGSESEKPVQNHDKFAQDQKEFWEVHRSCYLFNENTFDVSIHKCILASDEYVIRNLDFKIVDSVSRALVRLGDVKQRQKVCLTPVDENNKLLKSAPRTWDEIKDGNFMIINGQHNITASQQLQLQGHYLFHYYPASGRGQ